MYNSLLYINLKYDNYIIINIIKVVKDKVRLMPITFFEFLLRKRMNLKFKVNILKNSVYSKFSVYTEIVTWNGKLRYFEYVLINNKQGQSTLRGAHLFLDIFKCISNSNKLKSNLSKNYFFA